MSAKEQIPCNTDLLQSAKFILSLPRVTSTQFFCQATNLPGVSTQSTLQATPLSDLNIPGDKLVYEPLNVEFLLDEELQSWTVIYDWMRGIAFPNNFEEYQQLNAQSRYSQGVKHPQYADGELTILSANNTPKLKIKFFDMFPTSLTGVDLDIRLGADHTMTSTATFKFKRYAISRI
jgi:hypothetical protein